MLQMNGNICREPKFTAVLLVLSLRDGALFLTISAEKEKVNPQE